jgi:hypothetical protein
MQCRKRLRAAITVAVLSLALVVIILVNSVCSCLPDRYPEWLEPIK